MADIVERLEEAQDHYASPWINDILQEAAAEIVRLRGEVELMEQMARMQAARADAAEREARHYRTATIAPAEAKGDWQYESMRFLAYRLRQMSAVGFDADTCADAASWLERLSGAPQPADDGAVAPFGYAADVDPSDFDMSHTMYLLRPGEQIPTGCTALYTRPAGDALGAVRELPAKWRAEGYAFGDAYALDVEAALQHRGDSRGGEG